MSQPVATTAVVEEDHMSSLKRKRLPPSSSTPSRPTPPADQSGPETSAYARPQQSPASASMQSFKLDEEEANRHHATMGYTGSAKGRMSVSDMLSNETNVRREPASGVTSTPPHSDSRHGSPDQSLAAKNNMEKHGASHSEASQGMPHAKRQRLPSMAHNMSSSSPAPVMHEATPVGPQGVSGPPHHRPMHGPPPPPAAAAAAAATTATAAPGMPQGHPHAHMHGHGQVPPPHMMPHMMSHPPHPSHHHPHAMPPASQPPSAQPPQHPHQNAHYMNHPHHAPPTTPVTVLHAAQPHSGPQPGQINYVAQSPQHATFRHGPTNSSLSSRNRLNLTVLAPSYNEGQAVMVSPRHPVGGELMNVPTTVASAGPATTTYAGATMRSSVVALRTAAGPLPPKAKLTPRTPVGPEASRYRRPPTSATIPPTEVTVMSSATVTSPRTETQQHARSTEMTALPPAPHTPTNVIANGAPVSQPTAGRTMTEEEPSRRQFLAVFEMLYDRAFGVQQPVTPPSAPSSSSGVDANHGLGTASQQRHLIELAQAIELAGGLDALIRVRVQEALAATGLSALEARIKRLEAHLNLPESISETSAASNAEHKSSLETVVEESKEDVHMSSSEPPSPIKDLSDRVDRLEKQQQQNEMQISKPNDSITDASTTSKLVVLSPVGSDIAEQPDVAVEAEH